MPITRQRVTEWLQSEVTKAYFAGIKAKAEEIATHIAAGATLGENVAQDTAKSVGRIYGLYEALEVDIETVIEGD